MPATPARVLLRQLKERTVLTLDTGQAADSLEGLRLVKASRGSGWLWRAGTLSAWETRGVLQEEGRLLIWGETSAALEGLNESSWSPASSEAWSQTVSFVRAWTDLAASGNLETRFEAASVLPLRDGEGWAWAFLPRDLASVLTSILIPAERHGWSSVVLPEGDQSTWSFASASMLWRGVAAGLPWDQEDEAFLRQEMRELGRTLSVAELPRGLDQETQALWLDSLCRPSGVKTHSWRELATRWKVWATTHHAQPAVGPRTDEMSRSRVQSRRARQFWRRRGTVVLVSLAALALVLAVAGSIVWGILKPDPSDNWTPEQVLAGYYQAISELDASQFRKLVQVDRNRYPDPAKDEEVVSNLFVIRQMRIGYEHKDPLVPAETWVAQGKPPLVLGQMLFGLSNLVIAPTGRPLEWTVEYTRWSETASPVDGQAPTSLGETYLDRVQLTKTWKGWKISSLVRTKRPLP